jgi:hypothetical protein
MGAAATALLRGAIDAVTASTWLELIEAHPAWTHRCGDDGSFNVQSSSLRLPAVCGLDAAAIARALLRGEAGTFCRSRLGDALACDLDQCWVRRQYAPSRYPPGHHPHAWHQDGALAFDFLGQAAEESADALLEMVTCWIALTPCGSDAPGLELARAETMVLLAPQALREVAGSAELERPVLNPGDCLAFGGGVLHHTHVAPTMRSDRTSLELRLFDANRLPARLRGDRFLSVR